MRLLKEPLLHFLLLGAALFALAAVVGGEEEAARDDQIVVTAGKVEHLAAMFGRTWQRPPTAAELKDLVDEHVREEVAFREGVAMGLDRDDAVIRRRVRQKVEFIAEDLAAQVAPTEGELEAFLTAHAEEFRIEPRLWFRQVYFDAEGRGESVEIDARETAALLNERPEADASELGDRILLEHAYAGASTREIASVFGEAFAARVAELAPGAWAGPIESAYGSHVVIVDERRDGRIPSLEEVRAAVVREWGDARRREMMDRFYV
ncbi:MAG: peptidylprolyl isomerase, partial [Planctomycetota bacterium]|nr:peptidylprolyl isomerase [Planctomycetota bacterium]